MTNEEILKLAKTHQDALIGDGNELIGFEFSIASIEAFYHAAFNAGLEAAAKVCDESEVANLYGQKECAAAIRKLKEMK